MGKQSGQSLVEVLIALTLASIVVIALVILVLSGLKNAQFAQSQSKATKYAQQALEQIKTIRDRNGQVVFVSGSECGAYPCTFNDLWDKYLSSSNITETPCSTRLPNITDCYFNMSDDGDYLTEPAQTDDINQDVGDGLSREIIFKDKSTSYQNEKTIIVKVKWTDSAGSHESNLQTLLTNH